MFRIVAIAWIGLSLAACAVAALMSQVFAYIVCYRTLLAGLFLLLATVLAQVAHRLNASENSEVRSRRRLDWLVLAWMACLVVATKLVVRVWLANGTDTVKSIGWATTLVFAVFCLLALLRRLDKGVVLAGTGLFILALGLLYVTKSVRFVGGAEGTEATTTRSIKALPYAAWSDLGDSTGKAGVILCDEQNVFSGLNLYTSRTEPEAYLVDMNGEVVHKWRQPKTGTEWWFHAEMYPNGDLLLTVRDTALVRLDWNSNICWTVPLRSHHDATFDGQGNIYCLARRDDVSFWNGIPLPMLSDCVTVLTADGHIVDNLYFYELVKDYVDASKVIRAYLTDDMSLFKPRTLMALARRRASQGYCLVHDEAFDLLHSNSIEVLDRDIEGFCAKGQWLVSLRELDLIGVIDPNCREFVWAWGPGELDRQHCPSLLDSGNILIFDNGRNRGFSRVIELNPRSGKIEWQYKSVPAEKFFSYQQGFSQRLPNGNTLITESTKGRAFEVTREGRIVWEFLNPRLNPAQDARESIYRMTRIVDRQTLDGIMQRLGERDGRALPAANLRTTTDPKGTGVPEGHRESARLGVASICQVR